jgi:hypothetical protein
MADQRTDKFNSAVISQMRSNIPAANAEPDLYLWGAMRGTVTVTPGVDLTEGMGEVWEADA